MKVSEIEKHLAAKRYDVDKLIEIELAFDSVISSLPDLVVNQLCLESLRAIVVKARRGKSACYCREGKASRRANRTKK